MAAQKNKKQIEKIKQSLRARKSLILERRELGSYKKKIEEVRKKI
ncbi:MAG: hypothetical protein ABR875_00180 [Minisyncoccia bacterium]|jgi:hypothetical protein